MTMWDFFNNLVQQESGTGSMIVIGLVIVVCVGIVSISNAVAAFANKKKN